MASDFQRPKSWMAFGSTRAQRRAVALPGRRERAKSNLAGMPVVFSSLAAEWRKVVVMNLDLTECQPR